MSDDRKFKATSIAMIVAVVILVSVATYRITTDLWMADAVKRGYARWVVTSEYGQTKWEWIKKEGEKDGGK